MYLLCTLFKEALRTVLTKTREHTKNEGRVASRKRQASHQRTKESSQGGGE